MVLLILESLGSTELLFILVMALVFFGPRKLPQISRSLGKNIAEFRRASEDFKRTWDREVSLEDVSGANGSAVPGQNSSLDPEAAGTLQLPSISTVTPDQIIARQPFGSDELHSASDRELASAQGGVENVTDEPKHSPKNGWL